MATANHSPFNLAISIYHGSFSYNTITSLVIPYHLFLPPPTWIFTQMLETVLLRPGVYILGKMLLWLTDWLLSKSATQENMAHKKIQSPPVPWGVGDRIYHITEKSNSREWNHRAETSKRLCLKAAMPCLSQGENKAHPKHSWYLQSNCLPLAWRRLIHPSSAAGLSGSTQSQSHPGSQNDSQMRKHHTSETTRVSWGPVGLTHADLAVDQGQQSLPH